MSLPAVRSGGPYDLSYSRMDSSQSAVVATGPIAVAGDAPVATSFEQFRENVHGYVSAGVGTGGLHGFDGGVVVPLVPGRADLALSATTGQTVGLFGPASGLAGSAISPYGLAVRPGKLTYDAYQATLHLHPADDLDIYLSLSDLQLRPNPRR